MNLAQIPLPEITRHLRRLEVLDRVTDICLTSKSMEVSMQRVLDLVLEVFNADRAWFFYPCDPDESYWHVPMERTRAEWPGLLAQGVDMPMDEQMSKLLRDMLDADGAVQFGPDTDHPVPAAIAEDFSVKSQLMIALRPKIGNAWVFGLHHCAGAVRHHAEDLQLFTTLAHRISDNLSVLLSIKRLRNSERQSQGLADLVIDNAGVLVVVQDKDGRIVRFNRASENLTGYAYAEVEGKHLWDLMLEDGNADGREAYTALVQKSKSVPGHHSNYWLNKDGKRFLVEWTTNLLLDSFGNMEFMVSLGTDITEQKRDQLLSDMMKFSMNHMSDEVTWVTSDARIVYANIAACRSLGYTEEEMLKLSVPDFDPDFSLQDWPKHWEQLKKNGSYTFESMHRTKSGASHPVEISVNYMRIGDDEYNCAYVRDITRRKEIEADLRISATAFDTYESMLITDVNGVVLCVNQAFTESTGYSAGEIVGQTPRLLKSGYHNEEFYRAMWDTINRTGTWQGEIWDKRKNGAIYPKWLTISAVKGDDGVVTHYVGAHIDITERKAAEEKIQQLAFYDPLTKLPNRRLLLDRLKQAQAASARSGQQGGLLLIDLDNFKTLNDSLGHDIGDLLLQLTALSLETCVRDGDTVARLGGDEFVVVLENLSEQSLEAAAQAEAVGEKILAALGRPSQLDAYEHRGSASIGATLFKGHRQAADELMKQADIAMYQAKKSGRNALSFFDPQMQASITARASMEGELHKALESRQFHLHYQIQVDSSLHSLGAEALIRWIHPERGLVSPAQFIPMAEESGLIVPIGLWVLETACAQIKAWEQGTLTRHLVVAVNVSAKQFHQADFVAQVQDTVRRHCINPRLLKLELTEGMLLEDIEDTIATMNALNKIGIRFSLDDFGTGYSSLQYLKRLPLDQLKIDQSFVRDIATDSSDKAIVRTIIAMAQSLGMDVIAEGVETDEQRLLLLQNGCTRYQGYLFGRPMPITQFEAILQQD